MAGNWVVQLDDAQSKAYEAGELKYIRFPKEIFDINFTGPKNIMIKQASGVLSAPFFRHKINQTLGESAQNLNNENYNIIIGEGSLFYDESYKERWNKRFSHHPYSSELETTVVELSESI